MAETVIVAEGYHRARAVKPVGNPWGKSKEKGTDFVRINFKILDGEFAGRIVVWDGYFTDNTTDRSIEALQYCGCTFPGGDITNLAGIDANDVSIVVEHNPFKDEQGVEKTYARVAWVNALTRGVATELQMDAHAKSSFADKMRGKLAFASASKPTAPRGPAANGGSPPIDPKDKIPF
jgi:hypothetical protein